MSRQVINIEWNVIVSTTANAYWFATAQGILLMRGVKHGSELHTGEKHQHINETAYRQVKLHLTQQHKKKDWIFVTNGKFGVKFLVSCKRNGNRMPTPLQLLLLFREPFKTFFFNK